VPAASCWAALYMTHTRALFSAECMVGLQCWNGCSCSRCRLPGFLQPVHMQETGNMFQWCEGVTPQHAGGSGICSVVSSILLCHLCCLCLCWVHAE
jgi:hypothetical protein